MILRKEWAWEELEEKGLGRNAVNNIVLIKSHPKKAKSN